MGNETFYGDGLTRFLMHLSLETPTPHPRETWGIIQLKGKKEEKAPPYWGGGDF